MAEPVGPDFWRLQLWVGSLCNMISHQLSSITSAVTFSRLVNACAAGCGSTSGQQWLQTPPSPDSFHCSLALFRFDGELRKTWIPTQGDRPPKSIKTIDDYRCGIDSHTCIILHELALHDDTLYVFPRTAITHPSSVQPEQGLAYSYPQQH